MNESISATLVRLVGGFVSIAVSGTNWFRSRVASDFHVPELNLRSFLSLANLPRKPSCLSVRHPAGIPVTATEARRHEVNRVAASVCFACRWIHRHAERSIGRIPGFLPRSHAVLEHVDEAIGDLLPEIPSGRLGCLGDRHLVWIRWRCHSLQLSSPAGANSDSGCSFSNPDPASSSPPTSSSDCWPEALKNVTLWTLELATGL